MEKKDNSILCLSRITMVYENLSPAEKKIADYILENWWEAKDYAVARIANEVGVSQATIVRFCRTLGFSGVSEFKLYLRSMRLSEGADYLSIDKVDSELVIARKVTKFNKEAIDDTMSFLDGDALKRAADAMDSAGNIIIVAEGGSGSTARSMYDSLMQIGIPCSLVTDAVFQVYAAMRAKPGDVVVSVCHSGRTRNVIDTMRVAKEAQVTTIGIMGHKNSPMVQFCDIALYTGFANHPYYSEMIAARICELNVVSALHAILMSRNKERLERENNRERVNRMLELKRI